MSAYSIRVGGDDGGQVGVAAAEAIDPLVLAVDVGTSSARALVYDARGRKVEGWEVHRPYAVLTTPDGGVVIQADMLLALVADCLDAITALATRPVSAVAFDTFWHSLLGVGAAGQAVTPVYTWADTRSNDAAKRLRRRLDEAAVHERTGAALHSSYWPAKLAWLSRSNPGAVRHTSFWMGFAEYMYLHLFGGRRVSLSMASGTGIFDQSRCAWDEELLHALRVEVSALSPLSDFTEPMLGLQQPFAMRWPSLAAIPWYLALGDGACNSVGSGGYCPQHPVAMVGTSGAIRVVRETDRIETPRGLWTYRVDRRRIVQGGALSDGGNVFAWLVQSLQLPPIDRLEAEIASMQPDAHRLTVLPFLAGERSPDWNPDASAVFAGMTLATRPIDIMRASIEAVSYRFGAVYGLLKPLLPPGRGIIGSGAGLVRSPAWLQIMSDVFGEPLTVSAAPEATSRGAALLVLEGMGVISGLRDLPAPLGRRYLPDAERTAIYRQAMERQKRLQDAMLGAERDAEGMTNDNSN